MIINSICSFVNSVHRLSAHEDGDEDPAEAAGGAAALSWRADSRNITESVGEPLWFIHVLCSENNSIYKCYCVIISVESAFYICGPYDSPEQTSLVPLNLTRFKHVKQVNKQGNAN